MIIAKNTKDVSKTSTQNVSKQELLAHYSESVGCSKQDAGKYFNQAIDTIAHFLVAGKKVSISGFGTFESKSRASRAGHNPQTKKPIIIPAFNQPSFRPTPSLKGALNPQRSGKK